MTDPTWLSIVPATVAIALAFATREVIPALFAAVVAGGIVLFAHTNDPNDLNFISRFLLPALGSESFAKILLIYLWCLGGLMGMWEKTGGALYFARRVGGAVAKGPRSSLFFAWLLGVVFHQGGTISTVLAGTTVKPVTDQHRVSHEELAYVVDSTASPVATVLPFNAWPAYVAALAAGTIPFLPPATDAAMSWFYASIAFNFYGLFAVGSTLLFALGLLPWVGGRMRRAIDRARTTGALDDDAARPMLADRPVEPPDGYRQGLEDFLVPIGSLLGIAVVPTVLGLGSWINEAFLVAVLSAIVLALVKGMRLREVIEGFVSGCRAMTIGAIVLGLAVTLGRVSQDLQTAHFIVDTFGGAIPSVLLPATLMLLCMGIAFATGTSWGTYAVVFPVALPLAYYLHPDPLYLQLCFGAVLGGSVYGDQCSPISDTTILSSMFTGSDLMDHVWTQLPLASVAAFLGGIVATVLAVLFTATATMPAVEVLVVDPGGAVIADASVRLSVEIEAEEAGKKLQKWDGDWRATCTSESDDGCQAWVAGWNQAARYRITAALSRPVEGQKRCWDEASSESLADVDWAPDGALATRKVTLTLDTGALERRCDPAPAGD